jgi:hypothetical protein
MKIIPLDASLDPKHGVAVLDQGTRGELPPGRICGFEYEPVDPTTPDAYRVELHRKDGSVIDPGYGTHWVMGKGHKLDLDKPSFGLDSNPICWRTIPPTEIAFTTNVYP